MIRLRRRREGDDHDDEFVEIDPGQLSGLFAAPGWLRALFGTVGLILAAPVTSAIVRISADLSRAQGEAAVGTTAS